MSQIEQRELSAYSSKSPEEREPSVEYIQFRAESQTPGKLYDFFSISIEFPKTAFSPDSEQQKFLRRYFSLSGRDCDFEEDSLRAYLIGVISPQERPNGKGRFSTYSPYLIAQIWEGSQAQSNPYPSRFQGTETEVLLLASLLDPNPQAQSRRLYREHMRRIGFNGDDFALFDQGLRILELELNARKSAEEYFNNNPEASKEYLNYRTIYGVIIEGILTLARNSNNLDPLGIYKIIEKGKQIGFVPFTPDNVQKSEMAQRWNAQQTKLFGDILRSFRERVDINQERIVRYLSLLHGVNILSSGKTFRDHVSSLAEELQNASKEDLLFLGHEKIAFLLSLGMEISTRVDKHQLSEQDRFFLEKVSDLAELGFTYIHELTDQKNSHDFDLIHGMLRIADNGEVVRDLCSHCTPKQVETMKREIQGIIELSHLQESEFSKDERIDGQSYMVLEDIKNGSIRELNISDESNVQAVGIKENPQDAQQEQITFGIITSPPSSAIDAPAKSISGRGISSNNKMKKLGRFYLEGFPTWVFSFPRSPTSKSFSQSNNPFQLSAEVGVKNFRPSNRSSSSLNDRQGVALDLINILSPSGRNSSRISSNNLSEDNSIVGSFVRSPIPERLGNVLYNFSDYFNDTQKSPEITDGINFNLRDESSRSQKIGSVSNQGEVQGSSQGKVQNLLLSDSSRIKNSNSPKRRFYRQNSNTSPRGNSSLEEPFSVTMRRAIEYLDNQAIYSSKSKELGIINSTPASDQISQIRQRNFVMENASKSDYFGYSQGLASERIFVRSMRDFYQQPSIGFDGFSTTSSYSPKEINHSSFPAIDFQGDELGTNEQKIDGYRDYQAIGVKPSSPISSRRGIKTKGRMKRGSKRFGASEAINTLFLDPLSLQVMFQSEIRRYL